MAKVTITIEDIGNTVNIKCASDVPMEDGAITPAQHYAIIAMTAINDNANMCDDEQDD